MSFQPNNVDKVSMSLDDIIKVNRKQGRQNPAPGNNNNRNRNGANNNRQNSNGNRKPFGIANRSRAIQKNRRFNNGNNTNRPVINRNGNNNQAGGNRPRPRRPNNFNLNRRINNADGMVRRRNNNGVVTNNNNNRFNRVNKVGGPFRPNNRRPRNGNNNVLVGRLSANPVAVQQQVRVPRRPRVAGQPIRRNNVIKNTKIAMQTARKNVQKAKRLLAAKKRRLGQLENRFSGNRIAGGIKNVVAAVKPFIRQPRPRAVNKSVRVKVVNNRAQQRPKTQARPFRPIIRRNRGAPAANGISNRTVLY